MKFRRLRELWKPARNKEFLRCFLIGENPSRFTRKGLFVISFMILAIILFGLAVNISERRYDYEIAETKTIGSEIVRALEAYYTENNRYPITLDTLTPKYLTKVKPPIWGLKRWEYYGSQDEFYLRVNESEKTGDGMHLWLKYYPDLREWQMGD